MAEPTKEQLLERAAELNIDGRSSMNKDQLADAIAEAEAALDAARAAAPPADPADPDDGRPPLAHVAQERAENAYVRDLDGAAGQED